MNDKHGCSEESPCRSPMLRWVHSQRCQIDSLAERVSALRGLVKTLERQVAAAREEADQLRTRLNTSEMDRARIQSGYDMAWRGQYERAREDAERLRGALFKMADIWDRATTEGDSREIAKVMGRDNYRWMFDAWTAAQALLTAKGEP